MSIIRLSAVKDKGYAPTNSGLLNKAKRFYSSDLGVGEFQSSADMQNYLNFQVKAKLSGKPEGPIVVLVNGFDFDPWDQDGQDKQSGSNPHFLVYHTTVGIEAKEVKAKNASWPCGLGFTATDVRGADGLCLPFGWKSLLDVPLLELSPASYRLAFSEADNAASVLLDWLEMVAAAVPDVPIDFFCHSLGTHAVLATIGKAIQKPELLKRFGRVIMIGGAEYSESAAKVLRGINQVFGVEYKIGPHFYNFGCGDDWIVQNLAQNFGPKISKDVIGRHGLTRYADEFHLRWMDIQLDYKPAMEWFGSKGYAVVGDGPGLLDHWHYFTHRDNMRVYRHILRTRPEWSLDALRSASTPVPERMWV